jgi:hypothetical protein
LKLPTLRSTSTILFRLLPAAAALAAAPWLADSWVRLLLALSAILLLLPAGRFGGPRRERAEPARTAWLAALAMAALLFAAGPQLVRYSTTPWVRVWNVFHYYLGAEYFGEVGYYDLYDAALAADAERDGYWSGVRRVRDQRSYEQVERDSTREALARGRFSDPRWQRFGDDITGLQRHLSARGWRSVFTDRGYNASPFWTAVAHPLTHWLPASRPPALKLLAGLDLAVLAATFLLIGRTFGARAGWLALLLFALSPVDRNRMVGGFLQYDWLLAMAGAVCALRTRRAGWAAVGLAYATLVRIFPLLLAVSYLAPAVLRWIRSGRLRRDALRFAAVLTLVGAIGFGIGCLTPRGPQAWLEFAGNIVHHGEHHTFGEQRVGLKHLFTHRWTSPELEGGSGERRHSFEGQETLYRGVALALLAAWLGAVARRRGVAALLLGLVPFFALLVSSRYYWACLLLVPLTGSWGRRAAAGSAQPSGLARAVVNPRALAVGVLALFSLFYLADALAEPSRYASYLLFNGLLLVALAAWVGGYLWRDRQARRRVSPPRHA